MAAPVINPLPPAPNRNDAPADFSTKADTFVAALPPLVVQINASTTWVNDQVVAAQGYASSASASQISAKASADSAAAIAAAMGSQAGLPSLVGNARRALAVNAAETGVSFQTLIMGLFIEPALATLNVSGTYALNIGTTGFFSLTPTAATTLSFTLPSPSLTTTQVMVFVVEIQEGATAFAITWPGSIVWTTPGGVAPASPNAGKRAEYIFTVQGTTVKGRKGASN